MSAVQARVHASMEQEFKLIAALVRDYTAPAYDYLPDFDAPATAKKEDYDKVDIIPVSDPNASTMAQRIIQYQAAIQLAQQSPQIYNLPVLHRQMLEVMGIKDADKIVIVEEDQVPTDPVTENMNVLKAKPVKAFIEQDHDAHLAVHNALITDPKVAAAMGQNPQAAVLKQALMSHIMEHIGFQYRRGIETQLGTTLPPEDAKLSPEMEIQLAKLSADAAKQLLQVNQSEQAKQTAQQQAQDPLVMMQQKELQLKEQEINDKKEIELKKIDASKEIAMLNNEAKLLVQGEDAKVQGLFKGLDIAAQQINAQNALEAAAQVAPQQASPQQASPQGAPPAPAPQQPPSMPPPPQQPQPMG
jgi:hypothetical protein